jgi:hypothetical protein
LNAAPLPGVPRFVVIPIVLASGCLFAVSAVAAEETKPKASVAPPLREYFIGGGLTSMTTPPAGSIDHASGLNFVLYYGGRHLAGVFQFMAGAGEWDEYRVRYGGYSLGARYRLFDAAITPFAGAGLTAASSGFNAYGHDSDGGLGLAPYAELGAEVFRLSTIRGMVSVRVDQPLFDSLRDTNRRSDAEGRPVYDTVVTNFVPISFHLSVGWGFGEQGRRLFF